MTGIKNTTASARTVTADDVQRILNVGRLLLSVLTQAEVELLTQHLSNELPIHRAGDSTLKAKNEEDQVILTALDATRNMEQS